MNDWKIIAKEQMKRLKISQYALAEKIDCTQGAVAHWLGGRRQADIETINKILKALDLPPLSVGGIELSSYDKSIDKTSYGLENFEYVESYNPKVKRFEYPLIEWDDLENFIKGSHLFSDSKKRMIMSSKKLNKGAVLKVKGDSMSQLSNPTFPNGTLIIFETEDFKIESDKFYLIKLPDGTKIFKQLIRDANLSYLKSLNDNYKPIPINEKECVFLGKAVDFDLDQTID